MHEKEKEIDDKVAQKLAEKEKEIDKLIKAKDDLINQLQDENKEAL